MRSIIIYNVSRICKRVLKSSLSLSLPLSLSLYIYICIHICTLDLRGPDATQASSRTTLPQALHAFKATVRLIVPTPSSILRKYFGPSTSNARRFEPLGYDSQTPSIACVPYATEDEANNITRFLLALRCNMKRQTFQRLEPGASWLLLIKLTIKGAPNWHRFLKPTSGTQDHVGTPAVRHPVPSQGATHPGIFDYIVIECPRCGYTKRSHPDRLLCDARWTCSWCGGPCQRNVNASVWLCPCIKPWHTCHIHAVCAPPPPKRSKPSHPVDAIPLDQQRPLVCPTTYTNAYTLRKPQRPRASHAPGDEPPSPCPNATPTPSGGLSLLQPPLPRSCHDGLVKADSELGELATSTPSSGQASSSSGPSVHADVPGPGPVGPGPPLRSPAQAGPRPSLAPDISRTEVRPAWDAQTAHLMRTSRKVQAYFGAPDAVQAGCKRKGESQGEHSAKRPNSSTVGSSANVLPAIFAKCPVLARRFPRLAGQ